MQKEISNIQPFNDVFYKACKYNPLLSAVYYFGGNIYPYLANDIFVYRYNEGKGFKLYKYDISVKPEFRLINEMGISTDNNICADNFIADVKEAVNNEMFVYTPIDRFYWKCDRNSEWYQKKHWPHYFLIFGYDDAEEKFKMIDVHSTCYKCEITYQELLECYKQWCNLLTNRAFNITRLYIKNKGDIQAEYIDFEKNLLLFTHNMNNKKSEIFSGLDNVKRAAGYYASIGPDVLLSEDPIILMEPFFRLETSTKAELYRVHKFFGKQPRLMTCMKAVISNFAIIKGVLIKMNLTKECGPEIIKLIEDRLNRIYEYEYKFNEKLFTLLKR